MVRLAGFAVLAAAALLAAMPVLAQQAGGRFQLTQEGDGFLRLDTESGAVSFCQQVDGAWRCTPAEITEPGAEQAELEAALAVLTERLIVIETLLADLTATPAADASAEIAGLRDEIARLTEAQAALAAAIATVEPAPPPVDPTEDIAALRAEIARLAQAHEQLAAAMGDQPVAVDPTAELEALRAEMARVAGVVEGLATAPDDGLAPVIDQTPALERIEQMLATLLAAQDALAGDQRSLATAQAALEVQWATFAAEDRLAGIEATLVAIAQEQAAIAAAIASLNTAPAVAPELAALAQSQAALAADIALLRETLADIVALLIPPAASEPAADNPGAPGFGEELVNRLTQMVERLRGGE